MTRSILRVALFVCLLCGPFAGWIATASAAASTPPDPDAAGLSSGERLDALFDRVKLEQKQLQSLEARFVQRKESELFVKPEEARGTFSFLAPHRVRWEFLEPDPMVVVIDEDTMTTWYRDLERADVMQIGRYSEQVFKYMGASGSLETLLDYFRVEVTFPEAAGEPYRLTLDPRYPRIAKRIRVMDVWIDRESYVPVRLRYVEPGGDVTEYRFSDLQVNADIPADRFELDLPAGVDRGRTSASQPSP
ncbi:MAG: outer membrane lipoprotein carrier protein LolA [Acidobacteriota bacterium]|jgi:outer membrane lipoprotein carrier protein